MLASLFDQLGRAAPPGLSEVEAVAARVMRPAAPDPEHHPLVVPFAEDEVGPVGVLIWPAAPDGWPVPIVRLRGRRMELLAGTVVDYVRHVLARLEAGGRLDADLEAAGGGLYAGADRARTGLDLLPWVILKAGGAPWAYASAREAHVQRGDADSALIAAERACERFPGWAELHAWRWRLLRDAGRVDEARDAATTALALPIWTLLAPLDEVAIAAGWTPPVNAAPFLRRVDADGVLPADRAAYLMDAVAAGEGRWSDARPRLAGWYEEAGVPAVARLVAAPWGG